MKCYNCSSYGADNRLFVNWMGRAGEVYLCAQCLEGFKQHAWPNPGFRSSEGGNTQPFLADAGEKIKRERRLGELRERLRCAVEAENYETAAALRDEIYHMEKEVCVDVI